MGSWEVPMRKPWPHAWALSGVKGLCEIQKGRSFVLIVSALCNGPFQHNSLPEAILGEKGPVDEVSLLLSAGPQPCIFLTQISAFCFLANEVNSPGHQV